MISRVSVDFNTYLSSRFTIILATLRHPSAGEVLVITLNVLVASGCINFILTCICENVIGYCFVCLKNG